MDLNQLPPDFDYDFISRHTEDAIESSPKNCTQPPPIQQDSPSIADVRLSLEETHLQDVQQENADNTLVAVGDIVVSDITGQVLHEEGEVWSTPQVPYTGMTFGSVVEARGYYNAYAKRIGFSIRTNTSRRSGITKVLEKIQFVCNKEGKGKKSKTDENTEEPTDDSDEDDSEQDDVDLPHERAIKQGGGTWWQEKEKGENEVYAMQSKDDCEANWC